MARSNQVGRRAFRRSIYGQFTIFVLIGATATAVHYAVLITFVEIWHIKPSVATTVGFVSSALLNYTLNRTFTFKTKLSHATALPRFTFVAICGGMINLLVVDCLLNAMSVNYLLSQVAATVAVLLCNYTAHRLWTFRAVT